MSRPKGSKGKKNKIIKPEILKEDNPGQKNLEVEDDHILGEDHVMPEKQKELVQPSAVSEPEIVDKDNHDKDIIEKIKQTPEQKERAMKLQETLKGLTKKFGKESVKYANTIEVRERLPFKQDSLTAFTGGGIPAGMFICFWGGKGCSKTTIILDMIAKNQKNGKTCVYINGERSYDPKWAAKRGVDTEKLIVIDVETLEEGLDIIIKLCREKVADLIVFDSIHGLAPEAELYKGKAEEEKSTSDSNMALRARALTQFFEMSTAFVANAKCAIILIAQARIDLGGFIKLETLTGGHALLHNCRIIMKFRRGQKADAPSEKRETGALTEKGKPEMETIQIGFDFVAHVDKSQVEGCNELSEIHLPFIFAEGIKE
jgi:RecA/RadA recombinase